MALQPFTHLLLSDANTQVAAAETPKLLSAYDADDWSRFLKRTGVLKGWTISPSRAEMGSRAAFAIEPVDGSYESIYQEIDRTYVQSIKDSDEVKQSLSRYGLRETGLSAGISGGVPNAMANLQASLDRQNATKSDIQESVTIAADQVETFYVGMELTLEENLKVSPECIRFFGKLGRFSNASDQLKEFGRIFGLHFHLRPQLGSSNIKSVKFSKTLKDSSDEAQRAHNIAAEVGITAPPVSGKLAWNRKKENSTETTESRAIQKEVSQQMTVGLLLNDEWQPSSDPLKWKVVQRGEATPTIGLLYGIACEEPRDPQLVNSITQLCHEHNRQLLAATASKCTVELSFRKDEVAKVSLSYEEAGGGLVELGSVEFDVQSQRRRENVLPPAVRWRRLRGSRLHVFEWEDASFTTSCRREGEDIEFTMEVTGAKFSSYDLDGIKFDSIRSRHAITYDPELLPSLHPLPITFKVGKTFLIQPKSMPMIEIQSPSARVLSALSPVPYAT